MAGAVHVDLTVVRTLSMEALAKGSGLETESLQTSPPEIRRASIRIVSFGHLPWKIMDVSGADAIALARALAPVEPERRSRALARLHQAMSSALQRAAADAVLAACAQ
jgi:hypothetical protein